ncbi:18023_t:CDS:2, partial [Racocetra fulgida]
MENSLPKLSLEPRIGSAPFDVNEPDGSEEYKPASHNEIAIGIDVMNLILAEHKTNFIPNNPYPVAPGLISHDYPFYPQPTKDSQVQDIKLMLGMKRMAQILRSPDEKQVAVSLPQRAKKAVKLRLQQRSNSAPSVQENSSEGSNIHQQLITAQKAIFENELFDQANIDTIEEAPSADDVWTSETDNFDMTISPEPSASFTYKLTVKIDAFEITQGPELVIGGINNEGKHIRK